MRRSSYRGHRTTSQRRKLVWADTAQYTNPVGNSPGTNIDLLAGYRSAGGSTQGITIIRTHLTFGMTATAAGLIANDGVTVGLIVDDVSATNVTTNPTKANLDWMLLKTYWMAMAATYLGPSGTSVYGGFEIDLKAKRKCQELQQTLWLSLLQTTAVGMGVSVHARTLIALP